MGTKSPPWVSAQGGFLWGGAGVTNVQEYFVVKNWKKFQQYKDSDPDWIKLHMHLLDDYEFNCMDEQEYDLTITAKNVVYSCLDLPL